MNKRGQALVEFVIILPIFIMILLAIVDFGNIVYQKTQLENKSTDFIRRIENKETLQDLQQEYPNIQITMAPYLEKYQKVIFTKKITIITPGLDAFFGKNYECKVERVIPNVE